MNSQLVSTGDAGDVPKAAFGLKPWLNATIWVNIILLFL